MWAPAGRSIPIPSPTSSPLPARADGGVAPRSSGRSSRKSRSSPTASPVEIGLDSGIKPKAAPSQQHPPQLRGCRPSHGGGSLPGLLDQTFLSPMASSSATPLLSHGPRQPSKLHRARVTAILQHPSSLPCASLCSTRPAWAGRRDPWRAPSRRRLSSPAVASRCSSSDPAVSVVPDPTLVQRYQPP